MNDDDWTAWQARWRGATGPLPDVRARAQKEARAHRWAQVAFFFLVAVGVAGSVPAFQAPEGAVHAIGFLILAFCAAMAFGYLAIQRGGGARSEGGPRDALAFLERRLRVERLTAQLVRWVYLGLCACFVVLFPRLVETHELPGLEMAISFSFMAVTLAATFSAPWWVARRNRPHLEELARWRQWMDEQQL